MDETLSEDMNALLRLVSLGSAARNAVKMKVRQPLAELKVQPGSEADRRAVERFSEQILEELNVKKVTLHDAAAGHLLTVEVKPNLKTLGAKLGARLKEVSAWVAKADPVWLASEAQAGRSVPLTLGEEVITLDPADLWVTTKAPDGWAGVADRKTQVLIDSRMTDELKREGMARDIVRQVQDLRKKADLQMEDRIELYLATDAAMLQEALEAHREYICSETLTKSWVTALQGEGHQAEVKIEGFPLLISLRKV